MQQEKYISDYVSQAMELGATSAVYFSISDIAFDPRVILKCMFGCAAFGKMHTCPYQKSPLSMEEYEKIFSRYKGGLIIGCRDKKSSQDISIEIERNAFLDGYYFAFSLSDCCICDVCTHADGKECRMPKKARPALHAIGVDVFKTVHKLGLPLNVAKTFEDEVNWYSAVFIE